VTPILLPAGDPGAKGDGEPFFNLVVDLTQDDLCNVSLELTGVVEDAFALGSDLVSDFLGDLGAKGLTAFTEIILDKGLPDSGGDPPGVLEGGIEDLSDEVVDAALDLAGRHAAARVSKHIVIRGHLRRRTLMLDACGGGGGGGGGGGCSGEMLRGRKRRESRKIFE
jgi:hypothetical protein